MVLPNENSTNLLKILVQNANETQLGSKSNRYSEDIKKLACYELIRAGKHNYQFLSRNLKLPEISTLRKYMGKVAPWHFEGEMKFDACVEFLRQNGYGKEVGCFEDGTKVTEMVEYEAQCDTMTGLVAPINKETGLPFIKFFSTESVEKIEFNLRNYPKAAYLQSIIIKPIRTGSKTFFLGYFGTDNRFKATDVIKRYEYIYNEFAKRGVSVKCFGGDGDLRIISAQKKAINFGVSFKFLNLTLAGNPYSKYLGDQDKLHLCKKLVNRAYDFATTLILGKRIATLNHIIIAVKNPLNKRYHNLTNSDLDPTDHMDYRRIYKVTEPGVSEMLKLYPNTEGTVTYIKLVKYVYDAYVNESIIVSDRIFYAVFVNHFMRVWREWLHSENLKVEHFITSNCFDGLEINLVQLIGFLINGNAQDIHEVNSQTCEIDFRKLRSFTTVESTIVNVTMKSFMARNQKIRFEDQIVHEMKDILVFPDNEKRKSIKQKPSAYLSNEDLNLIFEKAINAANEEAEELGMEGLENDEFRLEFFLKPVKLNEEITCEENRENLQDEDGQNMNAANDSLTEASLTISSLNDPFDYTEETEEKSFVTLENGDEIHKAKLIAHLQSGSTRVSSDLRSRFISRPKPNISQNVYQNEIHWVGDEIAKGDNVLLKYENKLYTGCVLNFINLNQKTKAASKIIKDVIQMNDINKQKIGVLLEPAFTVENYKKKNFQNFHFYIPLSSYKCHTANNVDFNDKSIKRFLISL